MAVTTIKSHINMALFLKDKQQTTYLGLGGGSPWEDEKNPPLADPLDSKLKDPIGYKKVDKVSLCRRVNSIEDASYSTILYHGELWEMVPDSEAYNLHATHIYYETEVVKSDFPLGEYRQVGIFTGLEPSEGITKPNLLPDEVKDLGTLEFFENRQRQNRTPDTRIIERFIISVAERR